MSPQRQHGKCGRTKLRAPLTAAARALAKERAAARAVAAELRALLTELDTLEGT